MGNSNLTKEEEQFLKNWEREMRKGEKNQVVELFMHCNSPFQFARTHSTYVKDWERTKKQMEINLQNKKFPPNVSENVYKAIIEISNSVIQDKLQMVRTTFESKFGESIYNYLGPDGKTKFLGIF